MKARSILIFAAAVFLLSTATIAGAAEKGKSGEALFKENCAMCHPDGGNIINPQKTLHKKDRDANGVRTPGDIVKKMRNPGPGMTKFDKKAIPGDEAKKIAEYVVNTFK